MMRSRSPRVLAEFGSMVDAVEWAVTLQRGMAEPNASVPDGKRIEVQHRHQSGEVIVEGEERYGEGVNVAAPARARRSGRHLRFRKGVAGG
jgi:class 3 adenylate cyclase